MANGQTAQIVPYQQKVANVRGLLDRAKGQIKLALPKHLDADRMLRIAMTSAQKNPKLLECEPTSLVAAVIQSAQLGLEPDGVMGEAYFVPFKDSKRGYIVQFIPGYRGLMKLARNTGAVGTIMANVVRKRDVFDYSEGPDGRFMHVPFTPEVPDDADDIARDEGAVDLAQIAGPLTHAYAWARLKDGTIERVVLPRVKVLAIRARSSGWNAYLKGWASSNPWATDTEAMWRKTAIKQLAKYLPQSAELARAIEADDKAEMGLPQDLDVIDVGIEDPAERDAPPKSTAEIAAKVRRGKEPDHRAAILAATDHEQLAAAVDLATEANGGTLPDALESAARGRAAWIAEQQPERQPGEEG